jgi:hypothetical protein
LDAHDGALIEILHAGPAVGCLLGTVRGVHLKSVGKLEPGRLGGRERTLEAEHPANRHRLAKLIDIVMLVWLPWIVAGLGVCLASYGAYHLHGASAQNPVDVHGYTLTTLEGQRAFATAVRAGDPGDAWSMLGMGIVTVAMGAFMVVSNPSRRRGVPRALTKILQEARESSGFNDFGLPTSDLQGDADSLR